MRASQSTGIAIFLVLSTVLCVVYSLLIGFYDYKDGLVYYVNAYSIYKHGVLLPGFSDWHSFSGGTDLVEFYTANTGYSAFLALVFSLFDFARPWVAMAVSAAFYIAGVGFFASFAYKKLPAWGATLLLILVTTHSHILGFAIRPLTDPPFFGCMMALLWFSDAYPRRHYLFGFITGFAIFLREPTILVLPLLPILVTEDFKPRSYLLCLFRICLGSLPWLALMALGAELFTTGDASAPENHYVGAIPHLISLFSPSRWVSNVDLSFSRLFRFMEIGIPAGSLLAVSLMHTRDYPHRRIAWFTVLYLATLIFIESASEIMTGRYLTPILPAALFAAWGAAEFLMGPLAKRRVLAFALSFFFLLPAMNSAVFLTRRIPHISPDNLFTVNYAALERSLASVGVDGTILSNTIEAYTVQDGKRIVAAPVRFADFAAGGRNRELSAIVFLFNKVVNDPQLGYHRWTARKTDGLADYAGRYGDWIGPLGQDVIVDASGNRFEKVFEEKTATTFSVVFKPVLETDS